MTEGLDALSEKEKQTLRLMVRGHDAKSMANELSLSVHTINERLRAARRKLDVTSSREAARLLFESEASRPENHVYESFGDAEAAGAIHDPPINYPARNRALVIGAILMSIIAATLLFATPLPVTLAGSAESETVARNEAIEQAALSWLELVDARDWEASYSATAASFRMANTLQLWSDTATAVQGDLGAPLSRELVAVDDVPSPQGIVMVKYRTSFSNRADMTETLSVIHEDGEWKVAGIYIS